MRACLVISVLALGAGVANAGPFRQFYSTCYQPYYAPVSYSYYQPYSYATPAYTAPATPTPPAYSKDWRTALVEYSAALKEIEAYNQALNVIQPGFATSHVSYSGQGATLYGVSPAYSVKSVAQETSGLSAIDVGVILQQQARNAQQIVQAGSQISSEVNGTVGAITEGQVAVAKINAQGNANALTLQQAIELIKANTVPVTKTTTTTVSGGTAVAVAQPQVAQAPDRQAFLKNVARPDCANCHTAGPNMKGNFNVESVASLTRPQANEILRRITSTDPAVVMPKPASGQPVKHVPDDHMAAWVAMLSQVQ